MLRRSRRLLKFIVLATVIASPPTLAQNPLTLAPVGWFDVKGSLPHSHREAQVAAFRARETGLYFLLSEAKTQAALGVLRTDFRGWRSLFIPLRSSHVHLFDVDSSGNVFVVGDNSVSVYDSTGTQIRTTYTEDVTHVAIACVVHGSLIGVSENGAIELLAEQSAPRLNLRLQRPIAPPLLAAALLDHGFVVVEGSEAWIHTADLASRSTLSTALSGPELDGARQSYAATATRPTRIGGRGSAAKPILIGTLATSDSGEILVGLAGHSLKTGAVLLQVDSGGTVKKSYRCLLPSFESRRSVSNSEGHMLPSGIGITGRLIFVVDLQEGKVAHYSRM